MSETCTSRTGPTGCPEAATHVVLGSGLAADWRADEVQVTMGERRQPEFCAPHAEIVAAARNQAHYDARQAAARQPRTPGKARCAGCGERLAGGAYAVPGVGR